MLKDLYAKYYYEGNYNCAETIIRAGNEYYDLGLHDRDMIALGGFGAGMQSGNTCGAVLAGISILSMKYIEKKAHESTDIKPVTIMLIKRFNQKYGSVLCKDIKPQSFKPDIRCRNTIEAACDIIEDVIEEYDAKRDSVKR
ncbi:MAG: C_GCAxxG_C_C family protein [Clostridiales bacterium]|jgi:C_GCAxxG_C_C family probable redox protein|nr:C_GCAxxG_C_C family protein [Clostridiales bacterium]